MHFKPASLILLSLIPDLVHSASLSLVGSWGDNPSNLTMHVYVPDVVADDPPIVVAVRTLSFQITVDRLITFPIASRLL
jgi:hypothetical protein